jgi:pSer/pThr/pTyr-binding forkhead associated (FHA) protein
MWTDEGQVTMAQELLILTPDHKTKRVSLAGESLSLGRSHDNDLSYPEDASLSRKHLFLQINGDQIQVEDLGSKNGTLLNGKPVGDRARLSNGDVVRVGDTMIRIDIIEGSVPISE